MNDINKLALIADLASGTIRCELWHPEDIPPPAMNYIFQKLSNGANEVTLSIPICQDCEGYIANGELKLHYCYGCGNSQWRPNVSGDTQIIWHKECPECKGI